MSQTLGSAIADAIASGNKVLCPYITGGLGSDWLDAVRAAADAGADAIEIGIPFSDPVMDGPTIQRASEIALESGATPVSIMSALRGADIGVPLAFMTYYNLLHHSGLERFAAMATDCGITAAIVPDIPLEEAGPWCEVADTAGIETIMLAAPTADDERLARVAERSRGFVYAVGLVGITGVRAELAASSLQIAARLKALTDKPVLVGVGIGTPEQGAEVCAAADGVVVGSAIVQELLDGNGPSGVGELVARFRTALDQ